MVQYFVAQKDPYGQLAEQIGQSLGEGLGGFTSSYFANKSLNRVLESPDLMKKPLTERWKDLNQALAPYGQVGQDLLQRRMEIEGKQEEEQRKKRELNLEKESYAQVEKTFGKEFAEIWKAAPVGGRTELIKYGIDAKQRGISISEILKGISGEESEPAPTGSGQSSPTQPQPARAPVLPEELETTPKEKVGIRAERRKETLPLRQSIAERGQAAREALAAKEELSNIIDRGDLNDPTYATVAQLLPFNLGQRLLSDDTVEYRSSLVDDYKGLRSTFSGATRVAELGIWEKKIADTYLTDSQKKAALKARVNALNADVIQSEVAADVERDMPNLGVLQFQQEVARRTKSRMNELANQFLDETKSIFDQADAIKKEPLNGKNPEHQQIIRQMFQEALGRDSGPFSPSDIKKVEALAKKKGYKF